MNPLDDVIYYATEDEIYAGPMVTPSLIQQRWRLAAGEKSRLSSFSNIRVIKPILIITEVDNTTCQTLTEGKRHSIPYTVCFL